MIFARVQMSYARQPKLSRSFVLNSFYRPTGQWPVAFNLLIFPSRVINFKIMQMRLTYEFLIGVFLRAGSSLMSVYLKKIFQTGRHCELLHQMFWHHLLVFEK